MTLRNSIHVGPQSHCLTIVLSGCVACSAALAFADSKPVPRIASRVASSPAAVNQKLLNALDLARSSLDGLEAVEDYEATLSKQEVVGRKLVQHKMLVKIREEPFSVYVRFLKPHSGREVIFVDGKNDGRLLAHGTGLEALVGTVKLDPMGRDALKESRYPITMVGMANMARKVIEQWESEVGHEDVEVTYYPNAKLGSLECTVLETKHNEPKDGVKFHMTRLYIEKERKLPIRVEQYGFPDKTGGKPVLLEEYTYLDVKTNTAMTDSDFDTSNPAYDF